MYELSETRTEKVVTEVIAGGRKVGQVEWVEPEYGSDGFYHAYLRVPNEAQAGFVGPLVMGHGPTPRRAIEAAIQRSRECAIAYLEGVDELAKMLTGDQE